MNSDKIKLYLLVYFRFRRNCVAATEVSIGCGYADILADNGHVVYEVEIKTSYSDFCRDFKKKKHNSAPGFDAPNYFYFCVPKKLVAKCLAKISKSVFEKESQPGLMGLMSVDLEGNIKIVKRAKKNSNSYYSRKNEILYRLTSEVIRLYGKLIEHKRS